MKEIRKIITEFDKTDLQKEKVALASVVNVSGSSYRRIGARMLVRENGQWTGGISGGCLEGDALKRAKMAIYDNKASIIVYDTTNEDEHQIGVGLGCKGKIEVLFKSISKDQSHHEIDILKEIVDQNKPNIIAKIIGGNNTQLGEVFLISEADEGSSVLGLFDDIKEQIAEVSANQKSKVVSFHTKNKETYTLLLEFVKPAIDLVIIGENYDVSPLVNLANELGWNVHLVTNQKKIDKSVFNVCKKVIAYDEIGKLNFHKYTAVVCITHDYEKDKKIVEALYGIDISYFGILGPKKRTERMQDDLNHIPPSVFDSLNSPIGLDIGAEEPEEIAIAILSEVIAVFRKKEGGMLKHKTTPIHD